MIDLIINNKQDTLTQLTTDKLVNVIRVVEPFAIQVESVPFNGKIVIPSNIFTNVGEQDLYIDNVKYKVSVEAVLSFGESDVNCNFGDACLREIIYQGSPIYDNGNGNSGSGASLKFVSYQNHSSLISDLSQIEGTIGKVIGLNEPQEAFIFINGKWFELGNENVKVYNTKLELDNTKVIDPQLAYVKDTREVLLWTGTSWLNLPDMKVINQIQQDVSNKQNKLSPEQLNNLNFDLTSLAEKQALNALKLEVDDNYHLLNRVEEQIQNNYIENQAVDTLNTTNISKVMTAVSDIITDIANLKASPNTKSELVQFGTGLTYTTLAEAKTGKESTAVDGSKYDFLNRDNGEFHTLLFTINSPHWHSLGTGNIDLSNYATNQALQNAINTRVLQSEYDIKVGEIEAKLNTLTQSGGALNTALDALRNKDTALQQAIDAIKADSTANDDWIGTKNYTVGQALTPIASQAQLPSPTALLNGQTIIITGEAQQYMVLNYKYKGITYYYWAAVADSASSLQPGTVYTKTNWGELLNNPDTQKFLRIMMGDQVEANTFRILEAITGTFEIGKHIELFRVNSKHTLLADMDLKTKAKDFTKAINELFDAIELLKNTGGSGGGSIPPQLEARIKELETTVFGGVKNLTVIPTKDLGPKGKLDNLKVLYTPSASTLGNFAQIVSDTAANSGNWIVVQNGAIYEWVKIPTKPVVGTPYNVDNTVISLQKKIDDVDKRISGLSQVVDINKSSIALIKDETIPNIKAQLTTRLDNIKISGFEASKYGIITSDQQYFQLHTLNDKATLNEFKTALQTIQSTYYKDSLLSHYFRYGTAGNYGYVYITNTDPNFAFANNEYHIFKETDLVNEVLYLTPFIENEFKPLVEKVNNITNTELKRIISNKSTNGSLHLDLTHPLDFTNNRINTDLTILINGDTYCFNIPIRKLGTFNLALDGTNKLTILVENSGITITPSGAYTEMEADLFSQVFGV